MNYKPTDFENDINKCNSLEKYRQDCRGCGENFIQPEYFYCKKCREE